MGVNTKKKDLPPKLEKDKRKPPYDVKEHFGFVDGPGHEKDKEHFEKIAKLCHSMLKELKTIPKLTRRPKKTSNNVKLDDDCEGRKYMVPNVSSKRD